MKPIAPRLRGESMVMREHEHLHYLDEQHEMQPTVNRLRCSRTDLLDHLLDHHDWPSDVQRTASKGKLARLHLILHATQRLEEL